MEQTNTNKRQKKSKHLIITTLQNTCGDEVNMTVKLYVRWLGVQKAEREKVVSTSQRASERVRRQRKEASCLPSGMNLVQTHPAC